MTAADACERCRRSAEDVSFVMSEAASERMEANRLSPADIGNLLATAADCQQLTDRTWEVNGQLLDGSAGKLVVAFDEDMLTVL